MEVRTARYKLRPTRAQYTALRDVRVHLRDLRNACLQELKDSYCAACREAARHGRERPTADDWIVVRSEEIAEFLVWQHTKEPQLRAGHVRAEERRIKVLKTKIAKGEAKADANDLDVRPWRAKDGAAFGRAISKADQYRRLAEIRAAAPNGVGGVPLEVLRDQVDIVHRAMDAFFERAKVGGKPGFPRFKSYDRVRSLGCPVGGGISLKGDRLVAPMLWNGAMTMHMHRDLPGTPCTIRLTYDGRFWWVTIACKVDTVKAAVHPHVGATTAIDAGVRRLLTFDDGTFVENPRLFEDDAPRIRRLSRKLSRAERGSHNRRKVKRALARARAATADRRRTHHHKVSKDVVAKAEMIFIEDLKIHNMTRSAAGTVVEPGVNVTAKRSLNRSMMNASISTLYGMIRYKAASAGGRVISVDSRNTSTDCSECGGREPGARRKERYRCSCGAELDADHNAARNILARGLLAA